MAAILGLALASARGATLAQAVAACAGGECLPTRRLEVPAAGGCETLPYYGAAGLTLDTCAAVLEAARADADLERAAWSRAALIVGSSSLSLPQHESEGATPACAAGGQRHLAMQLRVCSGLSGPDFTLNTACTSSAHGLLLARHLIASGRVEHAVVLGVEQCSRFTASGFVAMGLLSPAAMRPMDVTRDGLVLGEAAAAVVLGRARTGVPRLAGGANRMDPHGETGADAGGVSLATAIRAALAQARVAPEAIGLIKAQAAGSPVNDAAEARALHAVFAPLPPLISLKPYLGHTLGASGCAELALLLGAWRAGFVPATPGCTVADPELGCVPQAFATPWHGGTAALNFIGFGGGQAVLVVQDAR